MRVLKRTFLIALTCAFCLSADASAQNKGKGKGGKDPLESKEAPPPPPMAIKFFASQRGRHLGHDALLVLGVSPLDGKQVKMPVFNTDMKSGKYEPKSEVEDVIKSLKQGDFVLITPKIHEGQSFIDKAESYAVAPGEDQPGGYVFKNAFAMQDGNVDYVDVLLVKYGQPIEAMLALVKDKDTKKMASDPALLDAIARLKEQRDKDKEAVIVVEAEIAGGSPKPMISSIDPYKVPEPAKMTKFVPEADVADGMKGPAVELDQGGKSVTLPLAGKVVGKKWVADAKVVAAAKAAKAGSAVLVRTRESGGKVYLKGIAAAPKEAAPPKEAKPPAKGA